MAARRTRHPWLNRQSPPRRHAELIRLGLRPAQITAIDALEDSLRHGRRRSLIQMATGAGKTYTACNALYRLIKFAGARRVLFLVDRGNLGRQTLKEFQAFRTPTTAASSPSFTTSSTCNPAASILSPRSASPPSSAFTPCSPAKNSIRNWTSFPAPRLKCSSARQSPSPTTLHPIETFDLIVTDECHRSIYNLWRQVLEYFDASLIGLTATPSKQTIGFFNQNLIMEYPMSVQSPTASTSTSTSTPSAPSSLSTAASSMPAFRLTTATARPARSAGNRLIRTFPTTPTNSTAASLFLTRSAPSSAPSATASSRTSFPAGQRCQRHYLRQRR